MWKIIKKIFGPKNKVEFSEEEVEIIKNEIKMLKDRVNQDSENSNTKSIADCDEKNSKCPKCKSINFGFRIKRFQGELKSSANSFGRNSSASVSVDTNEVCKCNDCGNEWKKEEPYFYSGIGMLEYYVNTVIYMFDAYKEYKNFSYDPINLDEKYYSLEEKEEALKWAFESKIKKVKLFWSGVHIITLNELVKKELYAYRVKLFKDCYDEDALILAGFIK